MARRRPKCRRPAGRPARVVMRKDPFGNRVATNWITESNRPGRMSRAAGSHSRRLRTSRTGSGTEGARKGHEPGFSAAGTGTGGSTADDKKKGKEYGLLA